MPAYAFQSDDLIHYLLQARGSWDSRGDPKHVRYIDVRIHIVYCICQAVFNQNHIHIPA